MCVDRRVPPGQVSSWESLDELQFLAHDLSVIYLSVSKVVANMTYA